MTTIEPQKTDLRWNGWGYSDTAFVVNKQGQVELTGSRYLFSGKVFPLMRGWAEQSAGLDINVETPSQVGLARVVANYCVVMCARRIKRFVFVLARVRARACVRACSLARSLTSSRRQKLSFQNRSSTRRSLQPCVV